MKYFPVLSGMLLPLSTFLQIQSLTAATIQPFTVAAVIFGILANICLFIRMLEKKIKAMHHVMIICAFTQGFLSLVAAYNLTVVEACFYSILSAVASITVAVLLLLQQKHNYQQHHYIYTFLDLSISQRQLILLTMSSITYTLLMAWFYTLVEKWMFDDALYWVVSTLTTIGFGDMTPKTTLGRVFLVPTAFLGIGLVGSNIWSVRQVILELLTFKLASQYSKSFGLFKDDLLNVPTRRLSVDLCSDPEHAATESLIKAQDCSSGNSNEPLENNHTHLNIPTIDHNPNIHAHQNIPSAHLHRNINNFKRRNTLHISRSKFLPRMTIVSDSTLRKKHIMETTMNTFRTQIIIAVIIEVSNLIIFGSLFAYLENWSVLEGIYFASSSLLTIGYGDFVLTRMLSRSFFIWYVFLGIAATTYLGSMLGEYASDQWIVTIDKIEKRVGRYETKAELKRLYKQNQPNDLLENLANINEKTELKKTRSSSKIPLKEPPQPILSRQHSKEPLEYNSLPSFSSSYIRFDIPEYQSEAISRRFNKCKDIPDTNESSDADDISQNRVNETDECRIPLLGED